MIDNEIKVNDVEIESGQNIKQVKEFRIDFNDKSQKMLLPNSIGKDFLSNIRPITENLNLLPNNIGEGFLSNIRPITENLNLLPNNIGEDFLSNIRPITENLNLLPNNIGEDFLSNIRPTTENLNLLPNNIGEDFLSNIRTITERLNSLSKSIGKVSFSMVKVTEAINSSAIKWLQKIDFSPLQNVLKSITRGLDLERLKALKQEFLQAMYECNWFPYVGSANSISLMLDVFDIITTSRGASKRREKRIDQVVFSYYTTTEIKNIKRRWKNSDFKPHIKKILGQAIEAHLRGEYVLTISCLASMWESLIYNRAGITTPLHQKQTKEEFKALSERNGFDEIFSEFYDHLILGHVNSPEEAIDGVPSRNGCLHGHYKKYPNKKASLNAILLTDFIISFQTEEDY